MPADIATKLVAEKRLDAGCERGRVGLGAGALHNGAGAIDEKLGEVPLDQARFPLRG